ncbi:hypothetical protein LTR16_001258 [Cryomyces antarcticus]|uniref:Protein arginine N-methyltransferase n=1 Tax=Cryomyces antarcticus TaxID=329879 RepID=A0ABR0M889_9PEZI|nr:hypothetical protein LTR39_000779 [Cryomyces antarcticus]KAK5294435.1 hypothetical protein LTR16_001258 [Cryomyces antarcticus]
MEPDATLVEQAMPVFYVGQHESQRSVPVSDRVLNQAQDSGLSEGVSCEDTPTPLIPPLTPTDTPLAPSEAISQLLAVTSPWIDLASPDPLVANVSRQVFNMEVQYAAFCGVGNVIVQGPQLMHGTAHASGLTQYARAVLEALNAGPYLQLQILLPMYDGLDQDDGDFMGSLAPFARVQYLQTAEPERKAELFDTWEAWDVIRSSRWFSEAPRLLSFPASTFLKNAKGYPALTKPHQGLISHYMRLRTPPWLLLSDVGPIPGLAAPSIPVYTAEGLISPSASANATAGSLPTEPTPAEAARIPQSDSRKHKDPTPYLSYIRHLQRNQPPRSTIERFGAGYQDYLQSPLQPLTDNLESITYEVFEKDPIKYDWYERAIAAALRDWRALDKPRSGLEVSQGADNNDYINENSDGKGRVVIAVVGAGRGPLVTRALRAAETTGVPIELWAVEKNPNAYVVLQRHNEEDWDFQVSVVKSDMRSWAGPTLPNNTNGKVDILVSELLGSFADNELSPECLDGVQHVLSADAISIPASYTAHLTPIAAPRLHADIRGRAAADPLAWETPYVVMLHQIDYLSTTASSSSTSPDKDDSAAVPDVQTAWRFAHPLRAPVLQQSQTRRGGSAVGGGGGAVGGDGANEHNARFCRLRFCCREPGVLHGLAGYFETVLYEGSEATVELSTNPVTMAAKSRDMISWFPIFFPLKVSSLFFPQPRPLHSSDVAPLFPNLRESQKSSAPTLFLHPLTHDPPSLHHANTDRQPTHDTHQIRYPCPPTANRIFYPADAHPPALRQRARSQHVAPDGRPEGVVRVDGRSLREHWRRREQQQR